MQRFNHEPMVDACDCRRQQRCGFLQLEWRHLSLVCSSEAHRYHHQQQRGPSPPTTTDEEEPHFLVAINGKTPLAMTMTMCRLVMVVCGPTHLPSLPHHHHSRLQPAGATRNHTKQMRADCCVKLTAAAPTRAICQFAELWALNAA